MSVNLTKGQKVDLVKESGEQIVKFDAGLGWDTADTGADFDLDVSVFANKEDGKVLNEKYFVFYNNLKSPCEGIIHTGDNLTGEGEGDDEVVKFDMSKIPADVNEMVIAVDIYQAKQRNQNFGQVENAFCRVLADGEESIRYDLSEDFSTETALVMGRIYRHNGAWKFSAEGKAFPAMSDIRAKYGVN